MRRHICHAHTHTYPHGRKKIRVPRYVDNNAKDNSCTVSIVRSELLSLMLGPLVWKGRLGHSRFPRLPMPNGTGTLGIYLIPLLENRHDVITSRVVGMAAITCVMMSQKISTLSRFVWSWESLGTRLV